MGIARYGVAVEGEGLDCVAVRAADAVDEETARDGEDERHDVHAAIEASPAAVEAEERLLNEVVGRGLVARSAEEEGAKARRDGAEEEVDRRFVPGEVALHRVPCLEVRGCMCLLHTGH